MNMNTPRIATHVPQVVGFDPDKVCIDIEAGIVRKKTSSTELRAHRAAQDAVDHLPNIVSGNTLYTLRVPCVIDHETTGDTAVIHSEYIQGMTVEEVLRGMTSASDRADIVQLIAAVLNAMQQHGFGWQDIAPRNIIINQDLKSIWVFDFERGFHRDPTAHDWERVLHGYALEEFISLVSLEEALAVIGDAANNFDAGRHTLLAHIKSRRKRALAEHLYPHVRSISIAQLRTVELIMAQAAQRHSSGLMPIIGLDRGAKDNGPNWYVGQVMQHLASSHPTFVTTKNATSPAGSNHIRIIDDTLDNTQHYTLERPSIALTIPSGDMFYPPTNTVADIVAVIRAHYKDLRDKSTLEVGCGDHGAIAHAMHAMRAQLVTGADIDPKAIHTVSKYGNPAITWVDTPLMDGLGVFDLIAFNAPQMPMTDQDRASLLDWHDSPGPKGYEIIRQAIAVAPLHLSKHGELVIMVFDFLLTDGEIYAQIRTSGFEAQCIGNTKKYLRPNGKTWQALSYIQQVFPNTVIHTDIHDGRQFLQGSILRLHRSSSAHPAQ